MYVKIVILIAYFPFSKHTFVLETRARTCPHTQPQFMCGMRSWNLNFKTTFFCLNSSNGQHLDVTCVLLLCHHYIKCVLWGEKILESINACQTDKETKKISVGCLWNVLETVAKSPCNHTLFRLKIFSIYQFTFNVAFRCVCKIEEKDLKSIRDKGRSRVKTIKKNVIKS